MNNKYKVSDLAKDFGVSSKEITAIVMDAIGEEKKSGASLNENEIGIFFEYRIRTAFHQGLIKQRNLLWSSLHHRRFLVF